MYSILPFDRRGIDTLFDDFERSFFPEQRRSTSVTAFRTDIQDKGDHFLLEAELPGFRKEDIDLNLHDGVLTISAKHEESREDKDKEGRYVCRERSWGTYQRSFDVSGIQEDKIGASYEDGVLKLILPKIEDVPAQSRKIDIH